MRGQYGDVAPVAVVKREGGTGSVPFTAVAPMQGGRYLGQSVEVGLPAAPAASSYQISLPAGGGSGGQGREIRVQQYQHLPTPGQGGAARASSSVKGAAGGRCRWDRRRARRGQEERPPGSSWCPPPQP